MFVFHCFSFWRLDDTMVFVTFYIDRAERTCRTQVFASTATDTAFRIDDRDHYGLVLFAVFATSSMAVTAVERNHLYSSDRTMSSTIPAIYSIGKRDAVLFHPHGVAYLYARFFGNGDGAYGPCRAHLRALGTFGTAISAFVRHFGLHESHQITRWPQDLIGTSRYAQLACRTMLGDVRCA